MADTPTVTELALALHTDLANIKVYQGKAPAVTRALLAEADAKLVAIGEYIGNVRHSLNFSEAPANAA